MFDNNPVKKIQKYAESAEPQYIEMPSTVDQSKGVIPLDSLPAQWWNAMWQSITQQEANIVDALNQIMQEILNVLNDGNVTPSGAVNDQLKLAIENLVQRVATSDRAGAVKSSSNVTIADDGTMQAQNTPKEGDLNNLATTEKATLVGAINSVVTMIGSLRSLATSAQSSIVAAINELKGNINSLSSSINTLTNRSVSTAQSGWCPRLTGETNKFLRADGQWATLPSGQLKILTSAPANPQPGDIWIA